MSDTIYKVSDLLFKVGYMNMFLIGVLVGASAFALLLIVMTVSKIHAGLIYLHQSVDNINKAVSLSMVKLNKIEKVTDHTMQAAENFVDAIRESAEQMMMFRPPTGKKSDDGDQFDDLRSAFDEGIRRMEEDDDEEGEEPDNKWKK